MKIELFVTPAEFTEGDTRSEPVIVIDVLRAMSTMIQALANGCRDIIPVDSVERALALHTSLFETDILLCGEREGMKIYGFDLGNSPLEYTPDAVAGKSLIFTSTNGSAALIKVRKSKHIYLCSFFNVTAIAHTISGKSENLVILCAGQDNHFALEDALCAGMLISRIRTHSKKEHELNDAALSALQLISIYGNNINAILKQTDHGRELIRIGMENDIYFCAQVDAIPVIPVLIDGKIIKMPV